MQASLSSELKREEKVMGRERRREERVGGVVMRKILLFLITTRLQRAGSRVQAAGVLAWRYEMVGRDQRHD